MQKLSKNIAALMLTIAAFGVVGCTKDNGGNGTYNGHDYIDLGLPSGTMWATCNVGATTPSTGPLEGQFEQFAPLVRTNHIIHKVLIDNRLFC